MGEMIFEVGATVRLRSGGPLMIIEGRGKPPEQDQAAVCWDCAWFNKADDAQEATFDQRVLAREEPPNAPPAR